jgi:succinoglycan biosynthesis transport protein ExoP
MMMADRSTEPVDPIPESPHDWEIGTLFHILRCRAWVVALWIAITLVLGFVYILVTPKVYEGKTVVQVEQDERPIDATADIAPESLITPEILKTYEQNLNSGALLLRLFKLNKLEKDPRYLAEQPNALSRFIKWLGGIFSGRADAPLGDAAMIRAMDNRTIVKLRRGTRLIDVSVRAQDPALAVQLSQSLVDEYIRLTIGRRTRP